MKPKDPKGILLQLMNKTSDIGSAVILGMAYNYLEFGKETYIRTFRSVYKSSVESYFSSIEIHVPISQNQLTS
jgi:hypothetical protein